MDQHEHLNDCYQTWNVATIPEFLIQEIANTIFRVARVNRDLVLSLMHLLRLGFDDPGLRRFEAIENGREQLLRQVVYCLHQMQRRRLCRLGFCPAYTIHWNCDGQRCYTVGGLHQFLLDANVDMAAQLIDRYFSAHRLFARYRTLHLCAQTVFSNVKDFFWRRRNRLDVNVIMDFNTLTRDDILILLQTAYPMTAVKPYIIPKWHSWFSNIRNDKWKMFVKRQIQRAGLRSVIVLKISNAELNIIHDAERSPRQEVLEIEVRSETDAVLFIWLCIRHFRRSVIAVSEIEEERIHQLPNGEEEEEEEDVEHDLRNEDQPGNEEEQAFRNNDERQRRLNRQLFPLGDFRIDRTAAFRESILACPYLAKTMVRNTAFG